MVTSFGNVTVWHLRNIYPSSGINSLKKNAQVKACNCTKILKATVLLAASKFKLDTCKIHATASHSCCIRCCKNSWPITTCQHHRDRACLRKLMVSTFACVTMSHSQNVHFKAWNCRKKSCQTQWMTVYSRFAWNCSKIPKSSRGIGCCSFFS